MIQIDSEKVKKIAIHYGSNNQMEILIEECAELIQAVQKVKRYNGDIVRQMDFISELADVIIMSEQITFLMSENSKKMLENEIDIKLKRQIERISV